MIEDDEYLEDDITAEDLTPLHSTPETEPPAPQAAEPTPIDDDEVDEPADPDSPEVDKGSKLIPHAKFHQANERAKSERQLRENAERRLDAILQAVNNQRAPQQQPEQPVDPDPMPPEDDIVALTQWNARQIDAQRRERSENERVSRERQEIQTVQTRVVSAAREDFANQAAADPTITEAYDFLRQSRGTELMAQGYTLQQAQQIFQQEEIELYHGALQRRQSPAQVIASIARGRGFASQAAAPAAEAPAAPQAPSEDRRRLHTSLSAASGSEAPRPMTAKDLLALDEDEFARVSDSVVNKLMRGSAA